MYTSVTVPFTEADLEKTLGGSGTKFLNLFFKIEGGAGTEDFQDNFSHLSHFLTPSPAEVKHFRGGRDGGFSEQFLSTHSFFDPLRRQRSNKFLERVGTEDCQDNFSQLTHFFTTFVSRGQKISRGGGVIGTENFQ